MGLLADKVRTVIQSSKHLRQDEEDETGSF
jgi:hypothetical protein